MVTGCGAALSEPTLAAGDARVDEHKGVWPLLAMQGHARRDEVPPRREAHRHDGPSVGLPPRLAHGSWEAAESATSAGLYGRTAASHWALGGSAARPECAAQPAACVPAPGGEGRASGGVALPRRRCQSTCCGLPPKSASISSSPAAGSRPGRARGKHGISQTPLQIDGSQV